MIDDEGIQKEMLMRALEEDAKEMIGGPELKTARKVLGYTQEDLADVLDCTADTVRSWETGKEPLSASIRLAILGLALSVREES
jgi:DNA-binding XRE family transcriptional regulator